MGTLSFKTKYLQALVIICTATILVFTPFMLEFTSEDGKVAPILNYQNAYAVDVGILQNQNLDATFNSSTGELVLNITGVPLLSLGLLNTQQFVYRLPDELKFILSNPSFKDAAKIEFVAPLLFGLGEVREVISGNSLILNSGDGTINGSRTAVLNLSLVSQLSAKLTINLGQLGLTTLPPSPDGILEFYGIAAGNSLISLEVLVGNGGNDEIATDVLDVIPPIAPIIDPVTDVDSTVTGKGEIGSTVHIVTPDGSYDGKVDALGNYNVSIPVQEAGTVITAFQTDAAGNESESASTIVIGTILEFTVPSEIRFKETVIGFREVIIPREIPNCTINVRDTRGQGSQWRIKARAIEPLTSVDGHTLDSEALVFVKDEQVTYLSAETLIFEGVTGQDKDTAITWTEEEGIFIKIIPSGARPGVDYTTTINWTLETAP